MRSIEKRFFTVLLILTMLAGIFSASIVAAAYRDVKKTHRAYGSIIWAGEDVYTRIVNFGKFCVSGQTPKA